MISLKKLSICWLNSWGADIKDLTVIAIKDTNHMIQWDEPTKVSNVISEWIEKKNSTYSYNCY